MKSKLNTTEKFRKEIVVTISSEEIEGLVRKELELDPVFKLWEMVDEDCGIPVTGGIKLVFFVESTSDSCSALEEKPL